MRLMKCPTFAMQVPGESDTVGVKDTVGVTSRMSLQVPLGRAAGGGGVVRDGNGFVTWGQHHF